MHGGPCPTPTGGRCSMPVRCTVRRSTRRADSTFSGEKRGWPQSSRTHKTKDSGPAQIPDERPMRDASSVVFREPQFQ